MTTKAFDFFDRLAIIFKWRKLIFLNIIVFCVLTAGITLILPQWFTAESTILPPSQDEGEFGLSSLLNKIPLGGLGVGLGAVSEEATLFLAILDSRSLLETISIRYNLMVEYKSKNLEETVKQLRKLISVKIDDEGTITIKASAKTGYFPNRKQIEEARKLAKDIANSCVEELDKINKDLKIERARNTRRFIEKRYMQNINDLSTAEEKFKDFQKRYGAIDLPEQTTAIVQAAAEIKAEIIAKEIEINVMKEGLGKTNNGIQNVQNILNQLKIKYKDMLLKNVNLRNDSIDIFMSISELPDLGIQYARLYRDILLQEKIMEFILPQYEQAKIQEAKDTPTVQVLDEAVLPIKRSKPKRIFLVILVAFIVGSSSVVYVFGLERFMEIRKQRDDSFFKIEKIKNDFVKDFSRLFRIHNRR